MFDVDQCQSNCILTKDDKRPTPTPQDDSVMDKKVLKSCVNVRKKYGRESGIPRSR